MEFGTYLIDVLGEFGANRGDHNNEYVHFGLASIFFAILLWLAVRRRSKNKSPRDALLVYGFSFGLLRELFLFVVKSLQSQGLVETATLELFFPPLEHTLLAIARITIGAAFILFLLESRKLTKWFLILGLASAVFAYLAIAPFWWADGVADSDIRFGKHWGEQVFHGHGLVSNLAVMVLLLASQNKSRFIWIAPFLMFFLYDALMIYNLSNGEIYEAVLGPIRHNLHVWAIPLLGYVYLHEQQVATAKMETELYNSERLRAVGQLAAGVAHDLNNILQVIHSFAELADDSEETDHESLAHVMAASDRAALLISQLLLFSRNEHPEGGQTQVDQTINRVTPMLDRLIGAGVVIEKHLGGQNSIIEMSEANLDQILSNLVVNSVYAMPDGGKITLSTAIYKDALTNDAMLRITVADNGAGMTAQQQERAFEPFYTTKPIGKGTGLGLATVFGLVTSHSGKIAIDSKLGVGTKITIELPVSSLADDAANSAASTRNTSPNGSGTIFIAEDEPGIMIAITKMLESASYTVIQASDGPMAVSKLASADYPPDLCLFDVAMPTMTGYQAYDSAVSRGLNAPVVFMSGNVPQMNGSHSKFIHLEKPFDKAKLLSAVRAALAASK